MSRLRKVTRPGSLVFLISDFRDMNEASESHLINVARHNDVVLIQVYDPASSRGLKIRKGRTYVFELAAFPDPTIPNNPNSTCGMAPGPAGDSYARGQGYFEDVPTNGPGWVALLDGGDLPFVTLVR